jgi:hypothetical protein
MSRRTTIPAFLTSLILIALVPSHSQTVLTTVHHDPQGRFTVRLPNGWKVEASDNDVHFTRGRNSVIVGLYAGMLRRLNLASTTELTDMQLRQLLDNKAETMRKAFGNVWTGGAVTCSFAGEQGLCTLFSAAGPDGKRILWKSFVAKRISYTLDAGMIEDHESAIGEVCQIENSFSENANPLSADVASCTADYRKLLAKQLPTQPSPQQGVSPSVAKEWWSRLGGVAHEQAPESAVNRVPSGNIGSGRPWIGIASISITPPIANAIGISAGSGLLIQTVQPGSPAEQAGLRGGRQAVALGGSQILLGGDLIVGFDGQSIATQEDLIQLLGQHRPGDRVNLTIYRGRQQLQVPLVLGQAPAGSGSAATLAHAPARIGARVRAADVSWGVVAAPDGTFQVQIPQHWGVAKAFSWTDFRAFSREGESVRAGKADVFPNQQSSMAMIQLFQQRTSGLQSALTFAQVPPNLIGALQQMQGSENLQLLAALGFTPQDLQLMVRTILPPYSHPVEVIRTLLPEVANGAIRNVRILHAQNVSVATGVGGAMVAYAYDLNPRGDSAFATLVAPSLLNYTAVPMRGFAIIYTLPPAGLPVSSGLLAALNTWPYLYFQIDAPEPVFLKSVEVYDYITLSYAIKPKAVAQQGQAWMQMLNTMHQATEQQGHGDWLALGNLDEYNTASDPTRRTMENTPCATGERRYACPGDPEPVCSPKPPRLSCEEPRILTAAPW